MTSVVDVVNKGLDKLGYGAITSLSDGTKAANLADRAWPLVRDEVLRMHPWNFAIKRTTTAPDSTAPSWGFLYQHSMPSDLIRIIELLDLSAAEYQIEGRKILCDVDTLYLRYVSRIEDPNKFDPMFIDTVACKLAYEMCEELTQSNTKKDLLYREFDESIRKARVVDSMENPPGQFEEDSWIEVRY